MVQRVWRGKKGRAGFRERIANIRAMHRAAVRMQLAWYRHKGMFPTFVLLRALYVLDRREKDKALRDYFQRRQACAIAMQFRMRRWYRRRRGAAVQVQALFRGYRARRLISKRHRAASMLQAMWKSAKWKRTFHDILLQNRAAVRLQLAWYRRNGEFSTFLLLRCLRTGKISKRWISPKRVLLSRARVSTRARSQLHGGQFCQSGCLEWDSRRERSGVLLW